VLTPGSCEIGLLVILRHRELLSVGKYYTNNVAGKATTGGTSLARQKIRWIALVWCGLFAERIVPLGRGRRAGLVSTARGFEATLRAGRGRAAAGGAFASAGAGAISSVATGAPTGVATGASSSGLGVTGTWMGVAIGAATATFAGKTAAEERTGTARSVLATSREPSVVTMP